MKIIAKMEGIKWIRNEDGAAYYEDKKGNDWYEFRNKLRDDKPIIVVESKSRFVRVFWIGDPTYVGLLNQELDVYQLDESPFKDFDDFSQKFWQFIKGEFVPATGSTSEKPGWE